MGLLKTLKTLFDGKVEETNQKIIEQNPEIILEQAIREQKEQYADNEKKAAEMVGQLTEHRKETERLKRNLGTIQSRISIAQREGNTEAVLEGNSLYKQRESELTERIMVEKEIEQAVVEIKDFLKQSRMEIDKLESEKTSLLARLNSANVKEGIMDLKSSMTFKNSNSFATARDTINKRINKINGRDEINKSTTTTNSKYFNGL